MATFDHLPPELLRLILSHLLETRATLSFEDHLDCQRDICSCALVRSSWRFEAQQLLVKEIWINWSDDSDKIFRRTTQPPFLSFGVESLTMEEFDLEAIVEEAEKISEVWKSRWKGISYLELKRNDLTNKALARFQNLRVIILSANTWWIAKNPTDVNFPELRRLVYTANTRLRGGDHDFLKLFAPSTTPRLVHLSVNAQFATGFDLSHFSAPENILQQIETIAIDNVYWIPDYPALIRTIASCSNLRHLALAPVHGYTLRHLAEGAAGLDLDSLHVPASFLIDVTQEDLEQLFVEQDRPGRRLHVRSLVVYGGQHSDELRALLGPHGAKIRQGLGKRPPFDTFDGTE